MLFTEYQKSIVKPILPMFFAQSEKVKHLHDIYRAFLQSQAKKNHNIKLRIQARYKFKVQDKPKQQIILIKVNYLYICFYHIQD